MEEEVIDFLITDHGFRPKEANDITSYWFDIGGRKIVKQLHLKSNEVAALINLNKELAFWTCENSTALDEIPNAFEGYLDLVHACIKNKKEV